MINPPCGAYDVSAAIVNIACVDNNFSVSQHMSGIVNSGSNSIAGALTVAGTSRFTGKATFDAAPDFLAGINVAISEVDTGTLNVSGLSSLTGGLTVAGALTLPNSSVVQSAVSSGYVDLANVQSIAGIKTFSAPPVMSGASIAGASIPGSSIVSASISSVQIAPSSLTQSVVSGGYVDASNAQVSLAGTKQWSGLHTFLAGIADSSTLSVSGITTLANVILPSSPTVLVAVSNVITIPLGGFSLGAFSLPLLSNITSVIITGGIVGASFVVYISGDISSRTVNKALSSGSMVTKNNLAGNTSFASGSNWLMRGNVVSSVLCLLEFINMT